VLLRFDRRDDILALPEPSADKPVVAAWRLFARGVAQAKSGDAEAAAATRKELGAAIRTCPSRRCSAARG
jgi:hypothetical protein